VTGGSRKPRPRRICVSLDPTDLAELEQRAARDRLPLSAAFLIAARDGFGRVEKPRRPSDSWDEGYDHSLQQELILLVLVAVEQLLGQMATLTPYGQVSADDLLVSAAQAAQRRIARGIPNALGGGNDGER
jgi:hypothetical protein